MLFLLYIIVALLPVNSFLLTVRKFYRPLSIPLYSRQPEDAIARLSISELTDDILENLCERSAPIIVTGMFDHTSLDCERWCEEFVAHLKNILVQYQVRNGTNGFTELFECSMADFLEGLQEESSFDSSWYLLDEQLLSNLPADLRNQLTLPQIPFGFDEFEFFPENIRPQKLCLIIGGTGARSFLHADPYEWLGWNVLLEGQKVWTFFPPCHESHLKGYRICPNAWGESSISIAAGWQSPVDLYGNSTETGGAMLNSTAFVGIPNDIWKNKLQVTQLEGETILIPPGWWHQVVHVQPSIAVASQHMKSGTGQLRVLNHIRRWCGIDSDELPNLFDSYGAMDKIDFVIAEGLKKQYGYEEGIKLLHALKINKNDI